MLDPVDRVHDAFSPCKQVSDRLVGNLLALPHDRRLSIGERSPSGLDPVDRVHGAFSPCKQVCDGLVGNLLAVTFSLFVTLFCLF